MLISLVLKHKIISTLSLQDSLSLCLSGLSQMWISLILKQFFNKTFSSYSLSLFLSFFKADVECCKIAESFTPFLPILQMVTEVQEIYLIPLTKLILKYNKLNLYWYLYCVYKWWDFNIQDNDLLILTSNFITFTLSTRVMLYGLNLIF